MELGYTSGHLREYGPAMTAPTVNDHLVQARANRDRAEWSLTARPNDRVALQWAVTAAFYAVLHCLTGYLAQRGIQVGNHQQREAAIADPKNGVPLNA